MKNEMKVLLFEAMNWCRSSLVMKSVFREISKKEDFSNITFQDFDVDTRFGADKSCEYQVKNVPTILIVKNERVIYRNKGLLSKDELINIIKKWK